jgi:hypothetical protein
MGAECTDSLITKVAVLYDVFILSSLNSGLHSHLSYLYIAFAFICFAVSCVAMTLFAEPKNVDSFSCISRQ